jgi:DNA-binding NarL/FixJ family response regulator
MASFSSTPPRDTGSGQSLPPAVVGEGGASAILALRVFLVEDSQSVRDRLSDFLSEPGKVEVIGFADTEADAVRQLRAQPVDVAIVDLNLKEGSGIGVIESIRALHATAPPTIIVLTNYAFPEFETACRKRGADHFFDKSTQFGAVKLLLQSIRRSAC